MTHSDEDAAHFYARLATRAEAEEYCPIEQVIELPKGESTTAAELNSLVRELFDSTQSGEGGRSFSGPKIESI